MSLQIIKGKINGPVRAVIYGVEGIGKSTIASMIPDSVTIDTEDGTKELDIARTVALDWRAIEFAVKELIADSQGFKAVIIDTADWLEKALIEHMLKQNGKKSIEDYGYGKGYTILQEHVTRFLGLLDQLIAKGVHVVFVAHAKVVRTSPPDQTDGFDRYELKLTKQVAPIIKEWADLVLFCNYRIQIVEGSDGRLKAQGGKERVMHTTHSAAWDAKNRFGLPDELPMKFEEIAKLFTSAAPRSAKQEAKAATNAATASDPMPTLATSEQVDAINKVKDQPAAAKLIEEAMDSINAIEIGELTNEQAANLLKQIKAVTNAVRVPPNVAQWLDENSPQVNDYLIMKAKWIVGGQTWRDLKVEDLHTLLDRADKFARAAGIPPLGKLAA